MSYHHIEFNVFFTHSSWNFPYVSCWLWDSKDPRFVASTSYRSGNPISPTKIFLGGFLGRFRLFGCFLGRLDLFGGFLVILCSPEMIGRVENQWYQTPKSNARGDLSTHHTIPWRTQGRICTMVPECQNAENAEYAESSSILGLSVRGFLATGLLRNPHMCRKSCPKRRVDDRRKGIFRETPRVGIALSPSLAKQFVVIR
ncbi:hypothetical protein BJ875DRAFT_52310 [Amylocarpus encephaloides]|uniref:Uncharacterized protein n=1 Tax=Amylocarpus encephaloides TaxID=45428 RepID=A0A9P7YHT0_9HELO|nr:hypothetical protein BJ875DRAFT_52310 [Amylocarpus encephaloides]